MVYNCIMNEKIVTELLSAAEAARDKAYCPYSKISVGAALLTKDGKIYTGANIENSAFGPTVCAERVAFFSAYHAGEREFVAIAVTGGRCGESSTSDFVPCGVCRQVMAELSLPELTIITNVDGEPCSRTLGELLPSAFGRDKL